MTDPEKTTLYNQVFNCMALHNINYYGRPQTVTMSEETKRRLMDEIGGRKCMKVKTLYKCEEIFGMKIVINNNLINGTFVVGGIIDQESEQ